MISGISLCRAGSTPARELIVGGRKKGEAKGRVGRVGARAAAVSAAAAAMLQPSDAGR